MFGRIAFFPCSYCFESFKSERFLNLHCLLWHPYQYVDSDAHIEYRHRNPLPLMREPRGSEAGPSESVTTAVQLQGVESVQSLKRKLGLDEEPEPQRKKQRLEKEEEAAQNGDAEETELAAEELLGQLADSTPRGKVLSADVTDSSLIEWLVSRDEDEVSAPDPEVCKISDPSPEEKLKEIVPEEFLAVAEIGIRQFQEETKNHPSARAAKIAEAAESRLFASAKFRSVTEAARRVLRKSRTGGHVTPRKVVPYRHRRRLAAHQAVNVPVWSRRHWETEICHIYGYVSTEDLLRCHTAKATKAARQAGTRITRARWSSDTPRFLNYPSFPPFQAPSHYRIVRNSELKETTNFRREDVRGHDFDLKVRKGKTYDFRLKFMQVSSQQDLSSCLKNVLHLLVTPSYCGDLSCSVEELMRRPRKQLVVPRPIKNPYLRLILYQMVVRRRREELGNERNREQPTEQSNAVSLGTRWLPPLSPPAFR